MTTSFAASGLAKFSRLVGVAAAAFGVVMLAFWLYTRAEDAVDEANERRIRTILLSAELRQSSDDLTQMARSFVNTGDAAFRRHYEEILGIRDGLQPRPAGYHQVYWDLVLADDARPRPSGPPVALLQLMREAGFASEELSLLEQAKALSDRLVQTERVAMALAESADPAGEEHRRAVRMLQDQEYRLAKASIMRPIAQADRLAESRTAQAVRAAQQRATAFRVALALLGLSIGGLLFVARRNLQAVLGGSARQVYERIAALGRGDFSAPPEGARPAAGSVLGWLQRTRSELAMQDEQRRLAEQAIRESELRFHRALDLMLEGCMLIGFDWTYLYVNEVAAAHGRLSREAVVGRRMTDLYPGIEETTVFRTFRRVMELRQPQRIEADYVFADGMRRWYEFSVVPTPEGIFVLSLDITERHEMADRLAASNEALERQVADRTADLRAALDHAMEASRAKSLFLSNMSHELRTPMNAIMGFSQLLQMAQPRPDQLPQLEEILRAGRHLLALIDDLLDLTRIEAGQLAVTLEAVDPAEQLRQAVRLLAPEIARRGIGLVDRLPPGLRLRGDAVRLRQVLLNLVSNAVKYNREGGSIVVDWQPMPGGRARLTVHDTGPGIEAADLGKLFTTFERLDAKRRGVEGTGIGLALCRQLMELMGGSIGVDSRPGVGSTFWIELPQGVAEAASARPHEKLAAPEPAHERHKPFTVLYIEDNLVNQDLVAALFERRPGWRLVQATTAEQGLELARSQAPDAVLLDVHLPGRDGFEVLASLRSEPGGAALPVIGLSADALHEQVQRARQAGMADYLAKPVDLHKLLLVLDGLARQAAAARGPR